MPASISHRPTTGREIAEPPASESSRATACIYVVDDEPIVAEVLQAVLQSAGFEARIFQDPLLALHTLTEAKVRPRLLLTDFAMGPVNGMELIQACKMVAPELKTILVHGRLCPDSLDPAAVKPDGFLGKPFQPGMLVNAVRALLPPRA